MRFATVVPAVGALLWVAAPGCTGSTDGALDVDVATGDTQRSDADTAAPADSAKADTFAADTANDTLIPIDATHDADHVDLNDTVSSKDVVDDNVSAPAGTVAACFEDISMGALGPDYDQFSPTVGSHCLGTNHQDIAAIERIVFLGDSITAGSPPTAAWQYYSWLLTQKLWARFGVVQTDNCALWGARTDDLLLGRNELGTCFPDGGDTRRTLVIMTIGGNDIASWAQDRLSPADALVEADKAAQLLRDGIAWLKDPARFPNGIDIIIAPPYEYTDATGDVSSCALSAFAGLEGNWIEGAEAVVTFQEQFMEITVDYGIDMIFLLETFCGHGYHHDDPQSPCYRGPDAELWFDLTCIHPNPLGHSAIADMFDAVVGE